eukprot:COSAG02_NODE_144_length_34086_cov_65.390944_37_plen_76_part_00
MDTIHRSNLAAYYWYTVYGVYTHYYTVLSIYSMDSIRVSNVPDRYYYHYSMIYTNMNSVYECRIGSTINSTQTRD